MSASPPKSSQSQSKAQSRKQPPEQQRRYVALVLRLKGELSWQEFSNQIGLSRASMIEWVAHGGGVGVAGRAAIARLSNREIKDVEAYAKGDYSLDQLLDPQFGRNEALSAFNVDSVAIWIQHRANLGEKLRLLDDLIAQVGSIAWNKSTQNLHQRLQQLLDRGLSLEEISEQAALPLLRIQEFYRGDRLPCEDEVLALASVFGVPIEELQKDYLAGVRS